MNPLDMMDEPTRAELLAENARLCAALTQAREALDVAFEWHAKYPLGNIYFEAKTSDEVYVKLRAALEAIRELEPPAVG